MQKSNNLQRFWFFRQTQRIQMAIFFGGLAALTFCSCIGIGAIAALTDDDDNTGVVAAATVEPTNHALLSPTAPDPSPTTASTETPSPTATLEPTNTPEPTATNEPTPTPSPIPSPTSTPTTPPTATPTPSPTPTIAPTPTMSVEEQLAQYRRDLDVREVVKNVGAYYNWKLYYQGEILSIIVDTDGTMVQIKAKYPGAGQFDWEGILILYDDPTITDGMYEGDIVGVYARPITDFTFTNSLGGEVTQPLFEGDFLQKLS